MAFVLINHGWTNTRQDGHWQRFLASALRAQGHQVFYPQYPDTENPVFEKWAWLLNAEIELMLETREVFEAQAKTAAGSNELIVIGHSLACVTWLKASANGLLPVGFRTDRLLLVAPPDPSLLGPVSSFEIDFSKFDARAAIARSTHSLTLLGSDADPWTPEGLQPTFGVPLGVEAIIIPGAKHLASGDGWGYWQGVIDWVNDPMADITKR